MHYETQVNALALCIAANIRLIIWGPPGHGKTSAIDDICSQFGLHAETVIASSMEPQDFIGMPRIAGDEVVITPPQWAKNVLRQAKGENADGRKRISVVFYDEISTATPATQAAMLRPILTGAIGSITLPKATRTIGAANPPDIAADGWDLSLPTANRFTHIDWELSAEVVRDGFTRGWSTIEVPRIPRGEVQEKNIRNARILVGSFLGSRPGLVSVMPKNASGSASKRFEASQYAFPTPRSWEVAATVYAAARAARFKDGSSVSEATLSVLLSGTVGKTAATEFIAYVKAFDLPDPEALLDNPQSFTPPKRGDQLFAIMSSVQHAFVENPTKVRWEAWGDILASVVRSEQGDVAFVFAKDWVSKELRPAGAVMQTRHREAFDKIFAQLDPDKKW